MMGAMSRLKVTCTAGTGAEDDWGAAGLPESVPTAPAATSKVSVHPARRSQELIPGPRCSIPLP